MDFSVFQTSFLRRIHAVTLQLELSVGIAYCYNILMDINSDKNQLKELVGGGDHTTSIFQLCISDICCLILLCLNLGGF